MLDECLTNEVKANFRKLLKITEVRRKVIQKEILPTFDELMERTNKIHPVMTSLQNVVRINYNICCNFRKHTILFVYIILYRRTTLKIIAH